MDKALIKRWSQESYRGQTDTALCALFEIYRAELDDQVSYDEGTKNTRYLLTCYCANLIKEMKRRTEINQDVSVGEPVLSSIIQACKEKIELHTVLSWYTDVFVYQSKWTYRCFLHGEDKHPSGVIYPEDQRFHCFVCGKHGDIFDAVVMYGRTDFPSALRKLSSFIGLSVSSKSNSNIGSIRGVVKGGYRELGNIKSPPRVVGGKNEVEL